MNDIKSSSQLLSTVLTSRLIKSREHIVHGMLTNNTFWTPIGCFNKDIITWLKNLNIIKTTGHELFYDWNGAAGLDTWFTVKYKTYVDYLRDNDQYKKVSMFFDDIDTILTAINKRLTNSIKERKDLSEWNRILDEFVPTEEEIELGEVMKEIEQVSNTAYSTLSGEIQGKVWSRFFSHKKQK